MAEGIRAARGICSSAFLYTPVGTSAIRRPADAALALAAFGLLALWKQPPWLMVLLAVAGGALLARF